MIKTKKIYKCPYKELPVLIMDMYVHISERCFLLDLLQKGYKRATLLKDFKGEIKINISYSIAGEGMIQ